MSIPRIVSFTAALALTACGAQQNEEQIEETPVQNETAVQDDTTTADSAASVTMPEMVVARVPVDAQGNELLDQVETRVVSQEADFQSQADAQAIFAQGERLGLDRELDADTSAESWRNRGYNRYGYWNTPWYPGKLLGRGTLWGKNPYLYNGGSYYRYTSRSRYYYPRYSYYTYCRTSSRYGYRY